MSKKSKLIIFAGANGSGKTTAAKFLLPRLKIPEFVNADEIARGLSPFNPQSQAVEAGKLVIKRRQNLLQSKKSFAFESTLAGISHAAFLKKASAAGYEIEMYYLFCADININLARIKNRVKQGGHHVPAEDVRRRYWRSLKNWLSPYKNFCDIMHIYDTTAGQPQEIAFWQNGEPMIRYDDDLCKRFADKVIKARDEY